MIRSRGWATGWNAARVAIAALIVVAVVAQFVSTFNEAVARGRDTTTVVANFFSFFTILSNVSAAIVLVLLACGSSPDDAASRSIPRGSRPPSPSCRRT